MHAGPEIDLEKAEFFRALPPDRFARVRALLRERRLLTHRVLFFEGRPAEYLWALRRGEVRLYRSSPDGHVTTLEVVGPGEVFGVVSAIDRETYRTSAEALTDGLASCLPRRVFLRLVQEDPRLSVEILKIVSRRLHETHERLRSFDHDPAPARLARALLRACRDGEARVTRRNLAEVAGTTVETAIRVLRRFERDGIIRGEVGRLWVLDEPALRRLAGDLSR